MRSISSQSLAAERAANETRGVFGALDGLTVLQPSNDDRQRPAVKGCEPAGAVGGAARLDHGHRADGLTLTHRVGDEEIGMGLEKTARTELDDGSFHNSHLSIIGRSGLSGDASFVHTMSLRAQRSMVRC